MWASRASSELTVPPVDGVLLFGAHPQRCPWATGSLRRWTAVRPVDETAETARMLTRPTEPQLQTCYSDAACVSVE